MVRELCVRECVYARAAVRGGIVLRCFDVSPLRAGPLQSNRTERFDREILNEMGDMGMLGCTIDGYGCSGLNYVTYGERRLSDPARGRVAAQILPEWPTADGAPILFVRRPPCARSGARRQRLPV